MNIQINKHMRDFGKETIEFEVKSPPIAEYLSEENYKFEYETGTFVNTYTQKCFDEIMKSKYKWAYDWSFTGRNNGWFAIIINDGYFVDNIKQKTIDRIERIVEKFFYAYGENLEEFYK